MFSSAVLPAGLELAFQFVGGVVVVLDGALVAAGDEDHVADAGGVGLFDGVLDQRLVDHRQHFLGLRLGGRQKAGAEARHGEHGLANARRRRWTWAVSGWKVSVQSPMRKRQRQPRACQPRRTSWSRSRSSVALKSPRAACVPARSPPAAPWRRRPRCRACRWPWRSRPRCARVPCRCAPSRPPCRSPCAGTGAPCPTTATGAASAAAAQAASSSKTFTSLSLASACSTGAASRRNSALAASSATA